jgi:hypothetical protein
MAEIVNTGGNQCAIVELAQHTPVAFEQNKSTPTLKSLVSQATTVADAAPVLTPAPTTTQRHAYSAAIVVVGVPTPGAAFMNSTTADSAVSSDDDYD